MTRALIYLAVGEDAAKRKVLVELLSSMTSDLQSLVTVAVQKAAVQIAHHQAPTKVNGDQHRGDGEEEEGEGEEREEGERKKREKERNQNQVAPLLIAALPALMTADGALRVHIPPKSALIVSGADSEPQGSVRMMTLARLPNLVGESRLCNRGRSEANS